MTDEISDNFSFVHLTDFHIGDPRGLKENIKQTIGWKAAKKCIEEINLINPDFLIITGDLVFGQIYPFEYSLEYSNYSLQETYLFWKCFYLRFLSKSKGCLLH